MQAHALHLPTASKNRSSEVETKAVDFLRQDNKSTSVCFRLPYRQTEASSVLSVNMELAVLQ